MWLSRVSSKSNAANESSRDLKPNLFNADLLDRSHDVAFICKDVVRQICDEGRRATELTHWFQKETLLQICEVGFMHKLRSLVTKSYVENVACLTQTSFQVGGRVGLLLWIRFVLPTFLPLGATTLGLRQAFGLFQLMHSKG